MSAAKKISATIDTFTAYLRECNMRLTSERMAVVEIMSKMPGVFSADQLHEVIENEAFPVSRATVYNTLNLLADCGIVKCLRLPDRSTALYKFAATDSSQIYYICKNCGKIREVASANMVKTINACDFGTFAPQSFSLTVYGLCRKCSRRVKK